MSIIFTVFVIFIITGILYPFYYFLKYAFHWRVCAVVLGLMALFQGGVGLHEMIILELPAEETTFFIPDEEQSTFSTLDGYLLIFIFGLAALAVGLFLRRS